MTRPEFLKPGLWRAGLLLAGACAAPVASSLEIRPSVSVAAVYTSNLLLATGSEGDAETKDIVTRADPRIDIAHKSPRIDLRADYTYTYLRFSEADQSDASFSAGSAALDLTLIKGLLTLETRGDHSQQLVSPEFSAFFTNVPIVDGRADQTVLETSPHLETTVGSVGIDMRYVLGKVSFRNDTPDIEDVDQPEIQDVDYQEAHTTITSEKQSRGLSWELFHDYEVYKYETGSDNKSQLAYLTLTYGLRQAGDFFVFGSAGLENDYRDFTSGSLEDPYLELGVRRTTARTLVEASFRERSFGSALNARIRRELNKGSIELAYGEDPSVQEKLFEQRTTDSTPLPQGVPDNIDRPGVGNRFVYRLLSATLLKELGRNQIEVVAFHEKRDDILDRETPPSDPISTSNSELQTGIKGRVSRQLGPRTTVGLEAEITNREFRNGNDDRLSAGRLVGTYALGRKLALEGWLARYQQQGSDKDDYSEIQAGLSANYSFR
jgi:uncharacterized protein (PEP-CTERM system associated)